MQGQVDITPFYAGDLVTTCVFCGALRFSGDRSNCCHNWKVILEPLTPVPAALHLLYTGDDEQARNFREHIRNYNSANAFASISANIATPPGRGPYCFKVHGQVYHKVCALYASPGNIPVYSQLYVLDASEAVNHQMQRQENELCRRDTMQLIQEILRETSPYAAAYRKMKDVLLDEETRAAQANKPALRVEMRFKRGPDPRRYNLLTHDEVAVVFVGDDGMPPVDRDI